LIVVGPSATLKHRLRLFAGDLVGLHWGQIA
jgi:hypothetical protein